MNNTDIKRFAEIMAGLAENFSGQLSKPGIDLRFDALSEYSIEQVISGASRLLRTRKTMGMPTVAEMIEAIAGPKISNSDAGSQQVNIVMQQIRQVGYYGTPALEDPVTQRLLNGRWSWKSLCSMTEKEHRFWAKEFIEAYQAFQNTDSAPKQIRNDETGQKLRLLVGKIGKAA